MPFCFALQQARLIPLAGLQAQLLVAQLCGHAALRGALEIAFHDQVRLIDFFECIRLFTHGHRQRTDSHRAAAKAFIKKVLSKRGRLVLARAGFGLPNKP